MCTRPPADLAAQLAADPARLRAVMEALPPDARRAAGLSRALAELEDEFAKADINADGTLSFSEFRSWAETLQTDGPRPADAPATAAQLGALFRLTFAPYVGFGLCDNALMICSGEAIDASIGVAFGLSTLAAAALGNALSNGTGMVLHGTIERCAAALGLSDPRLTPKQARNLRAAKCARTPAASACALPPRARARARRPPVTHSPATACTARSARRARCAT